MIKKSLLFLIVFYLLVLWQTSFLVYFDIAGFVPNIVLILVILINLLEKPHKYFGILAGFWGGFFLDIFSSGFIGLNTLILLAIALFVKMVLKKHVQAPVV